MRSKVLFPFLLVFSLTAYSQKSPFKFGKIDQKYFDMTHCPYDSSAGAFIIEEYGESTIDANFEILFLYHVRLKILNKSEFDRADIAIPHAVGDRVRKLEAATYNYENGKIIVSEVGKDQIFKEAKNEYTNVLNFTFPKVKEGSIIEYTYMTNYGDWTRLNTWYFQSSIPALYSQYSLDIPDFFSYKRLQTGYIPLATADVGTRNGSLSGQTISFQTHNYIAVNVPAFKEEPYMTTKSDFIAKIEFELDKVVIPGEVYKTYLPASYPALSKMMAESDSYGAKIKNTGFVKDEVRLIKDSLKNEPEIARAIFTWVKENIKQNYEVNYENLRKVVKEGEGTITEINMVLTAMLREAGFEANLVRLSTRSNGRLHPFYPIARKFNYTICELKLNGESILLDASEKNNVFGVLPKKCTNGQGLVISSDKPGWVDLNPNKNNMITYFGAFELDENTLISGNLKIGRNGYEALDFQEVLEKDGKEDYIKSFAERKDLWVIDSHEISDLSDLALTQTLEITAEDLIDDIGDMVYLNPIATGRMTENPFKKETRSFPVNFGSPYTVLHSYTYLIGDQFVIESLPEPMSIALPDKGGAFLYQAIALGNKISISCKYSIQKSEFSPEEYPYLKEFYARMVEKQGQQIVLKKKQL